MNADALSSIKKVGVISVVGKEFYKAQIGFNVAFEKADISDWHLDDVYERQIGESLNRIGGYEVVPITYSRSDFHHANAIRHDWQALSYSSKNRDGLESELRKLAAQYGLDAIIFVSGTALGGDSPNAPLRPGVGYSALSVKGAFRYAQLYVAAQVRVIDARTGKPLAVNTLSKMPDEWPGPMERAAPSTPGPPALAQSKMADASAAVLSEAREILTDLPATVWEITLRSLFNKSKP